MNRWELPKIKSVKKHTHTHTRLTALCPGLPRWAGTRKVQPIWILLKQETVSGSGISWAICKSASRSRQITMPAPHHSSFFTGRMLFLPPNQQRQSTEGNKKAYTYTVIIQAAHIQIVKLVIKRIQAATCPRRFASWRLKADDIWGRSSRSHLKHNSSRVICVE